MKYEDLVLRIPKETEMYRIYSEHIRNKISEILADKINKKENKIFIHTNLRTGLPIENINKIAGPLIEAWVTEAFEDYSETDPNFVKLESQTRLDLADLVLRFKIEDQLIDCSLDVKSSSLNINKSGRSPNITSFARIRTEYIKKPDFLFLILVIDHKLYSFKDKETGYITNVMTVTDFAIHDLKYVSDWDLKYNPSLGTGQLQIKQLHRIKEEKRTTHSFIKLIDSKYLKSSRKTIDDFLKLAQDFNWIEDHK